MKNRMCVSRCCCSYCGDGYPALVFDSFTGPFSPDYVTGGDVSVSGGQLVLKTDAVTDALSVLSTFMSPTSGSVSGATLTLSNVASEIDDISDRGTLTMELSVTNVAAITITLGRTSLGDAYMTWNFSRDSPGDLRTEQFTSIEFGTAVFEIDWTLSGGDITIDFDATVGTINRTFTSAAISTSDTVFGCGTRSSISVQNTQVDEEEYTCDFLLSQFV